MLDALKLGASAVFLIVLFIGGWFAMGALIGFFVRGFKWAAGV